MTQNDFVRAGGLISYGPHFPEMVVMATNCLCTALLQGML
jgi:hypothetical protein